MLHSPFTCAVTRSAALLGLMTLLAARASTQFTFEPPLASEASSFADRMVVGDVNEDGLPDVIVHSLQNFPILWGGPTTLSLGLGDGQFAAPEMLLFPNPFLDDQPFMFAKPFGLADFDADGHLDLLASEVGLFDTQSVSVCLGDGQGHFGLPLGICPNIPVQHPEDADFGDFNGDGRLDIAVLRGPDFVGNGRIMVVFGVVGGGFSTPVTPLPIVAPDPGHHGRLRVGDTNGDGFDDIVYTTGHGSPTLLSQGQNKFKLVACAGDCGLSDDLDFVLADVNGDGRDDVVSNERVLLATPGGSFENGQAFPPSEFPLAVAVADLDGDGALDVVLARNQVDPQTFTFGAGNVLILRGNGDGSFQTPGVVVSHVPRPRALGLADVDLDGRTDILAATFELFEGVHALMNRAYDSASPFLDLGGALPGDNGYPIQIASGTLLAGQPFAFELANGPSNGLAFQIAGFTRIDAPFKGGVMIPSIQLVSGPFVLDASGGRTLVGHWPSGGSGVALYAQFWMPNAGGPLGFVASSGVRAQIP